MYRFTVLFLAVYLHYNGFAFSCFFYDSLMSVLQGRWACWWAVCWPSCWPWLGRWRCSSWFTWRLGCWASSSGAVPCRRTGNPRRARCVKHVLAFTSLPGSCVTMFHGEKKKPWKAVGWMIQGKNPNLFNLKPLPDLVRIVICHVSVYAAEFLSFRSSMHCSHFPSAVNSNLVWETGPFKSGKIWGILQLKSFMSPVWLTWCRRQSVRVLRGRTSKRSWGWQGPRQMTLKPSTSGSCAKKIWLQVSAPGVSLPAPNAAPVHVFLFVFVV